MNVFEDLIEELKEENLIEETVIETSRVESLLNQKTNTPTQNLEKQTFTAQSIELKNELPTKVLLFDPNSILREMNMEDSKSAYSSSSLSSNESTIEDSTDYTDEAELEKLFADAAAADSDTFEQPPESPTFVSNSSETPNIATENVSESENQNSENNAGDFQFDTEYPEALNIGNPITDENEFFRRRATEEVNSLQIVEHILSAIEREQMKINPKLYDDISVKMALHDFLKITEEPKSSAHAQAEFKLMQETESWYSALAHRDKHISTGDLRRYCENTRPALSSQALVSLARFYRNSPFSEAVRNKFDVVITKLLTKEVFPDKREVIFSREELISHLTGLYADWSSIPLYETDNDSDVLLATLKIEDFISEANVATEFEELIKTDFFNRLRLFKESMGEKFFSPLLTGTAIECNVVVGNKYVDLVGLERQKNNAKSLEEKYQFFLDQTVSDATVKTLQLVEILKEKKEDPKSAQAKQNQPEPEKKEILKVEQGYKKAVTKAKNPLFKINKLVLAALILTVFGVGGLYIYVEYYTEQIKPSPSVIKVNLENSSLREYFKEARINRGTFFAITDTGWDRLSKDVKEDVLKKTLAVGSERGYTKIHLTNPEGKTVGFASERGIELDPK